jgi:hypothetical protein
MKNACRLLLGSLSALAVAFPVLGQERGSDPNRTLTTCAAGPACGAEGHGPSHWALDCFPRWGCPDDYCPHPYPRQCWSPYPPFYRCVSAGQCAPAPGVGVRDEKLTWWFLPTPRALREALWCRP